MKEGHEMETNGRDISILSCSTDDRREARVRSLVSRRRLQTVVFNCCVETVAVNLAQRTQVTSHTGGLRETMKAGLDTDGSAERERMRPFFLSLFGYVLQLAIPLASIVVYHEGRKEISVRDIATAIKVIIMDGITVKQLEEIVLARIQMRPIDFESVDLKEEEARSMMKHLGNTVNETIDTLFNRIEEPRTASDTTNDVSPNHCGSDKGDTGDKEDENTETSDVTQLDESATERVLEKWRESENKWSAFTAATADRTAGEQIFIRALEDTIASERVEASSN